jgi:gliding motility-associated-like protein
MKLFLICITVLLLMFRVNGQCPLGSVSSTMELVYNGNFSLGNTGFSSSYSYFTGGTLNEGQYAVNTNAHNVHSNFTGHDHTTGSGNFMIINGAPVANIPVWCQTVSVQPNTVYLFSAWVSSMVPVNPATLQFSINGINLGTTFNAPPAINTWSQFFISWNSGSDTSASICVVNQNNVALGNDFALDDISFVQCVCALTANAGIDTSFCPGDSVQLIANPPSFNYLWSTGSTSQNITVDMPGEYFLITSSGMCADSDTISVSLFPSPIPLIAGDSLICNGSPATLDAGANYISYTWSNGDTGQIAPVIVPGNYSVTVTNNFGCKGIDSINVVDQHIQLPVITGDSVFCGGDSSLLDPGSGFETYLWSTGDTGQMISVSSPGIFFVTVSDSGCIASDSISIITLQPVVPVINGDTVFCQNDSSLLYVNGTFQNLIWNNGINGTSIYVNQQGEYSVITTDPNGCSSKAEVFVTVNPNPDVNVETKTGCLGLEITFTLNGENANTFTWDFGDGSNAYNVSPVMHRYSKPGSFTVDLLVTSSKDCQSDTTFTILVDTISDVHANILLSTNTVLMEEPLHFQTEQAGQNIFEWNFGDGNFSHQQNPVYTYSIPGNHTVTLTVTNPVGCRAFDNTNVEVAAIYIANSFTPNGDGLNDVFKISFTNHVYNFSMEIFNRQGNKIFRSESSELGWDGNVNGNPAPAGVYEYIVEIRDDSGVVFNKVGKVTLIK